jgi:predicted ATP-binding protein involved in virulence
MFLKKIVLNRFCGFTDFALDVTDFTVLVGPNNGGKTTVLRAVKFALDALRLTFEPLEAASALS